jgi:hypothetical protein
MRDMPPFRVKIFSQVEYLEPDDGLSCYFFQDLCWALTLDSSLSMLYCKEPIPKIENKYSQKRKELRGHSPTFHIHVSVSDLYIPTMDLPILLRVICGPILGTYKSRTDT